MEICITNFPCATFSCWGFKELWFFHTICENNSKRDSDLLVELHLPFHFINFFFCPAFLKAWFVFPFCLEHPSIAGNGGNICQSTFMFAYSSLQEPLVSAPLVILSLLVQQLCNSCRFFLLILVCYSGLFFWVTLSSTGLTTGLNFTLHFKIW